MSAKTAWILAIVGLLGGNMIAMVVLITASHDGGSQVIPGYYDKAVHYDDAIDQAARDDRLGWPVRASVAGELIVITGAPAGSEVRITGYPRAHANRTFALSGAQVPLPVHGVLDLTITVDRGADHFVRHQALEAL